ncbi:biological adhesion [Homalodisca vitripennis]|nr:biological adhesion [Homalodisca vitripennis]
MFYRTGKHSIESIAGKVSIAHSLCRSVSDDFSGAVEHDPAPCSFNPMCSCRSADPSAIRDVSCLGVPFSKLPDLPHRQISHVDVVGAGLEVMDNASFSAEVETLRLITNNIISLSNTTFLSMASTLRSLDMSHNQLQSLPLVPLCSLTSLSWLNLHGNQIPYLSNQWCHLSTTLSNLFLGQNDLQDLDLSLKNLSHLEWITLDHNKLRSVPRGSLPDTLHTLSVQHNLLSEIPARTVDQLTSLVRLYLRGNLISRIPPYSFRTKKALDKLDLGNNRISDLPPAWFNSSITIRDLNLEFNNIRVLREFVFRTLNSGRIVLANNAIVNISKDAFAGLEESLEYADLEGNFIRNVSLIFSKLRKLKFLYLPNNRLSQLDNEDIRNFAGSLKALSLAGNLFSEIPQNGLRSCSQLSHLNIGYNQILEIKAIDFENWGTHLDTLLLMNNRIMYLNNYLFQHTPNLRELSLSFNKIVDIEPHTFMDVARSLESLEISFGLFSEEFPEDALRPLSSLLWLALDNNNIRTVHRTSLYTFSNLQYLNLDFNRIAHLPEGLFNSLIHTHLRDVRLGYNLLNKLGTETFSSLHDLQTVVLTGNNIRYVEPKTFKDLNNIMTILLTENNLLKISPHAFFNLPSLVRLDLQLNDMKYFTFDAFVNTSIIHPMTLNISHNKISDLYCNYNKPFIKIKVLDLTSNEIREFPSKTLEILSGYLRKLYLGFNRIDSVLPNTFLNMTFLNVLNLDHNRISIIKKRTFFGLTQLQILDLSSNGMKHLQSGSFTSVSNLRIINLRNNNLRTISARLFQSTKLERLDLSHNDISNVPDLEDVGSTMRELDLSYNLLEYLENQVFRKVPLLTTLNVCNNRLTVLPTDVFLGFNSLINLHLCSNPLRANFRELFSFTPQLRRLDLSSVSLTSVPPLAIPYLVHLNLTNNLIQDVHPSSADGLPRLRTLLLRANHLPSIPNQAWYRLPLLKELDLSLNPIKEITNSSFSSLRRLDSLRLTELSDLERVESGSFSGLRSLSSLHIQS